MKHYSHFQFSWFMNTIFTLYTVFVIFAYINQWGNNPIGLTGVFIFLILFVIITAFFYGMRVTVTDTEIRISMGIGIIRKHIPLQSIDSIAMKTNPWYYGLGIRLLPNGMLYTVQSNRVVEINLKDSGKVVHIGSTDRDRLYDAIHTRLGNVK